MAASASLCNFLSFVLPSKVSTPKCPPTQLLSSPSLSSHTQVQIQNQKPREGFVPLVAQEDRSHSESLSSELASVMCPALAFSNTLYFRSGYNVQVVVDDNESEERLLNRFRREVMKAGVIQECKRRRFFENKQDEKKRRTRDAAKRNRRRRPQLRVASQKPEETTTRKNNDGEDNWDLPEEDTPY